MSDPPGVVVLNRLRAYQLVPPGVRAECRRYPPQPHLQPGGWKWRVLVNGDETELGSPEPMKTLARARHWRTEIDDRGRMAVLPDDGTAG